MKTARENAAVNGDKKYQGAPCRKCVGTERYTINAACVACTKRVSQANTDRLRQQLKDAKDRRPPWHDLDAEGGVLCIITKRT